RSLQLTPAEGDSDVVRQAGSLPDNLTMQKIYIYLDQQPSDSHVQDLQNLGITLHQDSWIPPVGNHHAGFLQADMPLDKLNALASKGYVTRLDTAERQYQPLNDLAAIATNADDAWGMGYDGSGVTIAVLDSGLDVNHPDIPTPVGSWDYAEDDATIGNTVTGHGTHVAGISLGRGTQSAGAAAEYTGVAPNADLVFLKIGRDSTGGAPDYVIINALNGAVDTYTADIINISYGGWTDHHDGSSALEQAVDYAFSQGAAVFCSAGNEANDDWHYSDTVAAGVTTGYIRVDVSGAGVNNTALAFNSVWFDGLGTNNDLDLTFYDSTYTPMTDVTTYAQIESPRGTEQVYSNYNYYLPPGNSFYYLRVTNNSATDQLFHLYYDDYYNGAYAGSVTFQDPDPFYTVGAPATADNAIAVGSYTTRNQWTDYQGITWPSGETVDAISSFSSLGPRIDEAPKPSVVAPGSAIISARDQDVYTWPGAWDPIIIDNDGLNLNGSGPADYFVGEGTSMASPHAAGVAALVLDAHPWMQGDPATLRDALEQTATNGGTHDSVSGYGLVDAFSTILQFNLPPIADAGPDQTVFTLAPEATMRQVTLDGSASSDADEDSLTYSWTWEGGTASGTTPSAPFPIGTTTVTLIVNDGKTDSEPGTVDITVKAGTLPSATVPTLSQWGIIGMITALTGCVVWTLRRRVSAAT
ncbi:MAG: S8 family serine peptidase, partial [Chloroflexota bacterium]|nr:S8 family serine peptidase [Chloroflexota bacterium]